MSRQPPTMPSTSPIPISSLASSSLTAPSQQKAITSWSMPMLVTIALHSSLPALPSQLDPDLPDQLPETHGVYIFYGDKDFPLYVGKSNNLRKRVMSHFSSDHARGKEMSLPLS